MDLTQFQRLFNKEPKYRLGQAKKALFQDLIQNWQEATVLPLGLREELQINLAVFLNASNDKLRSKLMPINKKYPIKKILNAIDNYIKETRCRVMFEYIMINNLNDSEENAKTLANLMKKPLYFVNLILYNPTGIFEPSFFERVKKFKEILEKENVIVTQRYRFGKDIEGACGQLVAKNGRK